jgi:hypothetical protein
MCAERRLLKIAQDDARKHGISSRDQGKWIKRKFGSTMSIVRHKADGTLGCSVPCVFCRNAVMQLNIRVRCYTNDDRWFTGYLNEPDAPKSKLTTGQKSRIKSNKN